MLGGPIPRHLGIDLPLRVTLEDASKRWAESWDTVSLLWGSAVAQRDVDTLWSLWSRAAGTALGVGEDGRGRLRTKWVQPTAPAPDPVLTEQMRQEYAVAGLLRQCAFVSQLDWPLWLGDCPAAHLAQEHTLRQWVLAPECRG